jgi:hypothetical protein
VTIGAAPMFDMAGVILTRDITFSYAGRLYGQARKKCKFLQVALLSRRSAAAADDNWCHQGLQRIMFLSGESGKAMPSHTRGRLIAKATQWRRGTLHVRLQQDTSLVRVTIIMECQLCNCC